MAQTLQQIRKQIASLQQLAQERRRVEVKAVIQRTRETIKAWDLTPADLFDGLATRKAGPRIPGTKFANGKGGTWSGRGKRPQWLRDALAGGAQLADFLVKPGVGTRRDGPRTAPGPRGTAKRSSARSAGTVSTPRYGDETGNVWSGRGRRPKWLKDAIAAGKSIEDFARRG